MNKYIKSFNDYVKINEEMPTAEYMNSLKKVSMTEFLNGLPYLEMKYFKGYENSDIKIPVLFNEYFYFNFPDVRDYLFMRDMPFIMRDGDYIDIIAKHKNLSDINKNFYKNVTTRSFYGGNDDVIDYHNQKDFYFGLYPMYLYNFPDILNDQLVYNLPDDIPKNNNMPNKITFNRVN